MNDNNVAYHLHLKKQEIDIIASALAEQPYKIVAELIFNLQQQLNEQNERKQGGSDD